MRELKSVFIVSSPRHFVLSCAIAESSNHFSSPILIISDDFNGSPNFYKIIKEFIKKGTSPFSDVVILTKKYAIKEEVNLFKRFFLKKTKEYRQLRVYRQLSKRYEIKDLIASEVNSLTTQYFLSKIKKENPVNCHYLEDGLFSYIERPIKQVSTLDVFFNRIKYGFNYQVPVAVGSPAWVSFAWLLNPSFAIATIKQKKVFQIKRSWFETDFMQSLSKVFLSHFHVLAEEIQGLDVLIILDVRRDMNRLNPNYDNELVMFLKRALVRGKRVAIKGHPRDSQELLELDGVLEISRALPAEFLLPFLKKDMCLTGDFSTVFVDLKSLKSQVNIQVVQTDKKNTVFRDFFKAQEIDVVEKYEEIVLN